MLCYGYIRLGKGAMISLIGLTLGREPRVVTNGWVTEERRCPSSSAVPRVRHLVGVLRATAHGCVCFFKGVAIKTTVDKSHTNLQHSSPKPTPTPPSTYLFIIISFYFYLFIYFFFILFYLVIYLFILFYLFIYLFFFLIFG